MDVPYFENTIFYQLKHEIVVWCLYQMFILEMSNLTQHLLWCTCFVNVEQNAPFSILVRYHLLKNRASFSPEKAAAISL